MTQQIDLTYYEEGQKHPLGAVFTVYDDGEMLVTTYDIIPSPRQGEPMSVTSNAWLRAEDVPKLKSWLESV